MPLLQLLCHAVAASAVSSSPAALVSISLLPATITTAALRPIAPKLKVLESIPLQKPVVG